MRMASEVRRAADEEVHELKEQMQTMMQMVIKLQQQMDSRDNHNQQFAPSQPYCTQPEPIDPHSVCDEAGTSHASQNPKASSSSSSHLPSSQGIREVLLLSPRTLDVVIVIRGLILSKNPYTKVRGVELGPDNWEVSVIVPMLREEPLPIPLARFRTIGDVAGASVIWPSTFFAHRGG